MSGEQYSIFIKVDATQVNRATEELGRLGVISDSTEFSIKKLGKAAQEQDVWIKKLSASGREHVLWITKLSAASNEAAVASKTLSGAMASADSSTRKAAGAFDALNSIAKSVHSTFILFVGIELARFLRETAMNVGKAADAYTNMKSQLDLATNSQDELNKAFKESTVIANKYYANVTDIATAYAKFNPIIVSMGRSASDTTKVVSALSASLAISGRNAVDTSETYRQFSQAISGPNIQMEEMNTIIDSNQALWRGLQRQLPDVIAKYGSLKEAISKNAVTSKMLLDATIALGPEFEELAARKVPTMSNALTVLSNNFTMYIGEADKASGASTELATLILDLSEALKGSANDANNLGVFLGVLTQTFAGGKGIIFEYVDAINQLSDAYLTLTGRQAQAGANDPEIARLMQLGQGNVPVAELAQGKPTTTPKINPPVSKVDSKAAAKEAKDAMAAFKAMVDAQISAGENAEKIFAAMADTRKKRYEIEADQIKGLAELKIRSTKSEAMRLAITEEAQGKIVESISRETDIRQSALDKEMETLQIKLGAVQQEMDAADAHKLKQAERIELTTKQAELEAELVVKRQERTQIELDAIGQIQSAEMDLAEARVQANETLVKEEALRQLEIMSSNLEYAKEMATGLAEAFGEVGAAIGGMSVAMAEYDKQSATIEIARKEAVDKAEGDQKRITEINDDATKKQAKAQIKAYGDMTQAAQGFFKKGTKGYEAMSTATKVFRAFEIAQSAMSAAQQLDDIAKGVMAFVTGQTTKAAASAATLPTVISTEAGKQIAYAKTDIAAQGGVPIAGFALMAAMAALLAVYGIAGGGSKSSGMSGVDIGKMQDDAFKTSTATMLGSDEMSTSIVDALDIIAENSTNDLDYTKGMARDMELLVGSIASLGTVIAKSFNFDISKLNLGTTRTSNAPGFDPLSGMIWGGSKTTRELIGQGVSIAKQTIGQILDAGIVKAKQYADVLVTETNKTLFGLFSSTSQSIERQTSKLDESIKKALGQVFDNAYTTLIDAGKLLGEDAEKVRGILESVVVQATDLKLGKNAEENAKKLQAWFSAQMDAAAAKAFPDMEVFKRAGEGMYETVIRVTEGVATATGELELLGMQAIDYTKIISDQKDQIDVGAEITRQTILAQGDLTEGTKKYVEGLRGGAQDIAESYRKILQVTQLLRGAGFGTEDLDQTMINAAGGLSAFEESLQSFYDNYLTDGQKVEAETANLEKEFARLGKTMPKNRAEFYQMAFAINTSTEEGKKLFAQFVRLNEQFSDLQDASEDLAETQADEAKKAADAVTKAMEEIRKKIDSAMSYQIQITRLLGNEEEALRLEREKAMEGMDDATRSYASALYRLQDANKALVESQKGLETAYKSLLGLRDKYVSLGQNLRKFYDELTGASGPNSSPAAQYQAAAKTFRETASMAIQGSQQALADLPDVSKAFLEASKQYNASGAQYQSDFNEVLGVLKNSMTAVDTQIEIMNRQLAVARMSYDKLGDLDGTTMSVQDAINNMNKAIANYTNAQAAYSSATAVANAILEAIKQVIAKGNSDINNLKPVTPAPIPEPVPLPRPTLVPKAPVREIPGGAAGGNPFASDHNYKWSSLDAYNMVKFYYQQLLGRDPENEDVIWGRANALAAGAVTSNQVVQEFRSSPEYQELVRAGFVPGFAKGGMASPGLALVGEQGPELVSFGSTAHVSTANQTRGFFSGLQASIEKGDADQTNELQALVRLQSAANQQLIKEMKELKGEMAELSRKAKIEAAA